MECWAKRSLEKFNWHANAYIKIPYLFHHYCFYEMQSTRKKWEILRNKKRLNTKARREIQSMRKTLKNNKNIQLYFLIISWCKSTSSQGRKRRNSHCKNIMKAEFLYEVNQQKGKRHQNKREILLPCFTVKHTMPRGRWLTNTNVFTSKTSVLL